MTTPVPFSSSVQMTSLEISTLVESNHADVRRSIERLAERGVIQLPPTAKVENKQSRSNNNKVEVYIFDLEHKRDSYVVVAQLSPEFTARLVDRWQELESGQASPAVVPILAKEQAAAELLETRLKVAALFQVPLHISQQEAVKVVIKELAVDYTPLLLAAPAQQQIADEDEMLEPEDLAKRLGFKDGKEMNFILHDLGLQVKQNGGWLPTEKGAPYCVKHAWTTEFKSGYNLKWRVSAIRNALAQQESAQTLL